MNDSALEAVEILRFLNAETPRVTTRDEAAGRAVKLGDWAQVLLPQARAALDEVADECRQREAITRIIGWSLKTLERTFQPTLQDAIWHVESLTTCCRLLADVVLTVGEGRVVCFWCKTHSHDTRLIHVVEVGSGPGCALSACPPCRKRYALTPFIDQPGMTPPASVGE
ncbi:hypothetical protein ABZS88_00195 [Streptomyces sp. NPDC005480]|uniref:hypothetical protein n=1 Tax=Streptomyces sp. NPDC005480 TaxID=3154880 RepID=UPI0033A10DBD